MEARVTKVVRVSARFSNSLARRRFRPNQEKVRSTTQRRGRTILKTRAELAKLAVERGAAERQMRPSRRRPLPRRRRSTQQARTPRPQPNSPAASLRNFLLRRLQPREELSALQGLHQRGNFDCCEIGEGVRDRIR